MSALIVKTPFAAGQRVYRKGQVVDSNDSVVQGREHLFTTADDQLERQVRNAAPAVERATAGPGEVRGIFRGKKSKSQAAQPEEAPEAPSGDEEPSEVTEDTENA